MGFGHGAVSIVTVILVVASVAYLSRSRIEPAGGGIAGRSRRPRLQPAEVRAGPVPGDPRYADPRQGDPRYGADPGYRNPQYEDQRDYRY